MMTEPTQTGASELVAEVRMNPRQAYIEGLAGRANEQLQQELQNTVAQDPGMASLQSTREAEMAAGFGQPEQEYLDDGAAVVADPTPVAPVVQAPTPTLPDYVVQRDDGFFIKAVVDGEERLVPMDQARSHLQKEEAVESRFRYVNQKIVELTERERELNARATVAPVNPNPPPSQEDVDTNLQAEAKVLVSKLFNATEDEAAAEVASILRKNRAPASASVDPERLVSQTAEAVLTRMRDNDIQKDVKTGFEQFGQDYPEIVADPLLFRVADDLSNVVQREHPD
jgi:hypothetical protein